MSPSLSLKTYMLLTIVSKKSKTIHEIQKVLECDLFIQPNDIRLEEPHVLIRWGYVGHAPQAAKVFNTPEAIKNACNKALCRQILAENDIPVPEATESDFPCIGRPAHHTQGRKFFICRNFEDVRRAKTRGAVYFSKFYPKTNEYRVHIGHNKVILYSVKIGDRSRIIWNHAKNGFVFEHLDRHEWDIDIIRLAKRAIKAVGLDFGAVDIMADPTDSNLPRAVVCEINTAPALSDYAIVKYARYFYGHI